MDTLSSNGVRSDVYGRSEPRFGSDLPYTSLLLFSRMVRVQRKQPSKVQSKKPVNGKGQVPKVYIRLRTETESNPVPKCAIDTLGPNCLGSEVSGSPSM